MKIITGFFTFVLTLLSAIYIVLFTQVGNNFLKPYIESAIQKQTHLPSRVQKFSLRFDSLEILLFLNKNNSFSLNANFSLSSQSFNAAYRVKFNDLATLSPITKQELQGELHTQGTIVGAIDSFDVDGVSNVASSKSKYHLMLEDFVPSSIVATVSNLDLAELLYITKNKAYMNADLNLNINFKDIRTHKLDGVVKLTTDKGFFNTKVMREDFNITIPNQTVFALGVDAILSGDDIDYTYILNSNLAKISSKGKVTPEPFSINATFGMYVKELALLKPMSGLDVRGDIKLKGSVEGNENKLIVDAKTDFAKSKTTLQLILANFKLKSLNADVKGLKIQKALYMLKLPHYSDGSMNVKAMISDANLKHLRGKIRTTIKQGEIDTKYLSKEFAFNSAMPSTHYSMIAWTKLHDDFADTKIDINSNLVDINTEHLRYNLSDSSLVSDYIVKIKDLQKLYFLTSRNLKGKILAKGKVKKSQDLDFTMNSKLAGGDINVHLHNDDLKAKFYALESLEILDILKYPQLFTSKIDGVLEYNLAHSKGDFRAKLSEGRFKQNQPFDLTKKYAHIDLYKENFSGDLDAKINASKILASLFLKSNVSSIKSKNAKINTKENSIDATVDISANNNPIKVKLQGDINAPKVTISADELIKREATKAITKEVNKFLKNFF